MSNITDSSESGRDGKVERWVIWWKPMWLTFGIGPLGVFALCIQFWLAKINALIGFPFGNYVSLARVCLVVLGFFLVFISWPVWRPAGWKPGQDDEAEEI
jgi:hypothetical protein